MCDRIHTATLTDGQPIVVELVEYPSAFDGPAGDALAAILSEVASERARQIALGYDDNHDDNHSADGLEGVILHQLGKVLAETRSDAYRRRLVQIATCAVAAVLSWDRCTLPASGSDGEAPDHA